MLDRLRVRDPSPPDEGAAVAVREELVRCVWFGQHFSKSGLATADGTRVEIISPGWWNVDDGPDFRRSEVLFENAGTRKGDVEIHVRASGWRRHGHDKQPTYDDVILHVVLANDLGTPAVQTDSGRAVPQLVLSERLDTDLEALAALFDEEAYPSEEDQAGPCRSLIADSACSPEWIARVLDAAGDERILAKSRALSARQTEVAADQALYEGFMEALGYRSNKHAFRQLAMALPLRDLFPLVPIDGQRENVIQALLLHVGGLLPLDEASRSELDDESRTWIETRAADWKEYGADAGLRQLDRSAWRFGGMRPANSPWRRLAAAAALLAQAMDAGLFRLFLTHVEACEDPTDVAGRNTYRQITHILGQLGDPHWDWRCSPGGKRLTKPMKLLGKGRIGAIIVNVLIPLLLSHARREANTKLEAALHAVYSGLPALPPNHVTRTMAVRLFGSTDAARSMVRTERRQQGLHQVFRDFCDAPGVPCGQCALLAALQTAEESV